MKKYFHSTTCIVIYLSCSNIPPHNSMSTVTKGLSYSEFWHTRVMFKEMLENHSYIFLRASHWCKAEDLNLLHIVLDLQYRKKKKFWSIYFRITEVFFITDVSQSWRDDCTDTIVTIPNNLQRVNPQNKLIMSGELLMCKKNYILQ